MKKCIECKEEKDLSEFYTHSRMADGHLGKCKDCVKSYSGRRRQEKLKDPEWAAKEAERQRKKSGRFRSEGRASPGKSETKTAWRKRNPEKVRAHNAVARALRKGILVKHPCEECGDPEVHAHHDDYEKVLDVRWLCPKHHGATRIII